MANQASTYPPSASAPCDGNPRRNCGLDYFDFYQLWGLQTMEVFDKALEKGGMIEGIRT